MKNYFWFVIILIFGCERKDISKHDILSAEKISGLSFSSSERDSLLPNVIQRVKPKRHNELSNNGRITFVSFLVNPGNKNKIICPIAKGLLNSKPV